MKRFFALQTLFVGDAYPSLLTVMIQTSTFDPHPEECTTPWWIPPFSLSPSLRLFFLRVIVVSLVVTLGVLFSRIGRGSAGWAMAGSIGPAVVALVHHSGTAFGPRLFPILVWVDLILTLIETAFFIFLAIGLVGASVDEVPQYGIKMFLDLATTAVTLGILALSLVSLSILKVLAVLEGRGSRPLRQRLDLARSPTSPWWEYPVRSLFGKVMSERGVPGEQRWISILRGVLAILSIFTLVGFGSYQAIILPLSGVGVSQYREYRATSGLSGDQLSAFDRISWSVILVWLRDPSLTEPGDFFRYVTVQPRWTGIGRDSRPPECIIENATLSEFSSEYLDVAVVSCPQSPDASLPAGISPLALFPQYFITINFTEISGPIAPEPAPSFVQPYVSLFVGMTTDIDTVVANTDPTTLLAGSSSLGRVRVAVRERLTTSPFGFLGFKSRNTFMVASMAEIQPNPFASSSADRNISTIGLTLQDTFGDWHIFQDSLGDSVLTGLSTVGGLGALLSTLLAMFLGTSLMRIVIRVKPNSPFGYIHNLGSVQREIAKQCDKEYPGLSDDIRQLEETPGVIAYLFNTLIDVEPLGYGTMKTIPPQGMNTDPLTEAICYAPIARGQGDKEAEGDARAGA